VYLHIGPKHLGQTGQSYAPIGLPGSSIIPTAISEIELAMAVLIPRIRMIGVRLSEEEYSVFERFFVESGARSMSEAARIAICKFVHKPFHIYKNSLASVVSECATQVRDLEKTVFQLNREIALLRAEQKDKRKTATSSL
jgi:hypothetical protein